ncbi:uncharacterized protein LOC135366980 [Ornithodoros turicata]|uniref:uncharacterized protein LOC135366980 n=1 Tax=Ornithodoros turicata TaxID=34597 RepID=UPI00313989C5
MPLAPRHGTPSWEELLGRLLCTAAAALSVACQTTQPDMPPHFLNYRVSARCNASCAHVLASTQCSDLQGHLPFCSHLPLQRVLAIGGGEDCGTRLHSVLQRDAIACQLSCEFHALLSRYDCLGGYAAKWNCHSCARVYQEWTCAMLVPVYPAPVDPGGGPEDPGGGGQSTTTEGVAAVLPVRPCREFCHRVEEQCPYIHPAAKEQYAGEPVFICIDPNIPDLPSISNSSYGPPGDCYRPCHVNASLSSTNDECTSATIVGEFTTTTSAAASSGSSSMYVSVVVGERTLPVLVTVLCWVVVLARTCARQRLS